MIRKKQIGIKFNNDLIKLLDDYLRAIHLQGYSYNINRTAYIARCIKNQLKKDREEFYGTNENDYTYR